MKIIPVQSGDELDRFINLPYQIYKGDPIWVAPLKSEQRRQFSVRTNPMLMHCDYQLFLAMEGDRVLGRIAAFIDHLAVDHWHEQVGLFGSYESSQDPNVSNGLLSAARYWLKEKGMQSMRGPWSFASQEWGLVCEGFTPPPVILAPYNPSFYNQQLSDFGMHKVKELLVYYVDAREGYDIQDRIKLLTEKVARRYAVKVRPINMNKMKEDVATIVRISNLSLANNWGYYPVTEAEAAAMAHDMRDIVNPKAILLAEDFSGIPIGFAMALPDVNLLLKGMNGSLLPFGWLKMLFVLPRLTQYRMWALGVIPEYQGKAIDTLLYRATYDALYTPEIRMEINYVLEDNERMNNALFKLGVKPLRRYRIYQMQI